MDFVEFLSHKDLSSLSNVFCFVHDEYPLLCGSLIRKKFAESFPSIVELTMLEDEAQCKAQLETTFLGTTMVYWLPENSTASATLYAYLAAYKGPHTISFFNKNALPKNSKGVTVELPKEVTRELFMQLFAYTYSGSVSKYNTVVQKIFKQLPTVSLDTALLLIEYCMLIGNKSDAFINEWLTEIVVPEKSLFSLSTYFFAKKEDQFFALWNSVSADYSEVFWTVFWSEQLFKASAYISLNRAKNFAQAKRVAYRLPFSFIQKDWKVLTVQELSQAHDQLYTIDWNIKNGLNAHFEHFYLNFMLK